MSRLKDRDQNFGNAATVLANERGGGVNWTGRGESEGFLEECYGIGDGNAQTQW